MKHKIIGFAYSDSDNSSYIKNQLEAIKNLFPSLETELADENDSRLERYIPAKYSQLLPLYMVLKNDAYKAHRNGKYDNSEVFNWLRTIPNLDA